MIIGIDLLWVKPGKSGGTESLIRNLLDGFAQYGKQYQYVLFTAYDNDKSFRKYEKYPNFRLKMSKIKAMKPLKRYLQENFYVDFAAKKENVDVMFIPVYSKPFTYGSKIPYVTSIADLQAMHYPEYFSKAMYWFMRFIWWYACKTSDRILTISEYVRDDIINYYPFVKEKCFNAYIPIISQKSDIKFEILREKYHIETEKYYYCVSSMLPHKNLDTILKVISKFKKMGRTRILVLSGVGGEQEKFEKKCREYDIEDCVINTQFVTDSERDCLYENCKAFLFPSVFEGFGMPPIEAMRKGKNVIMTRKTCLMEVTEGKAIYVDDPYNIDEWMEKIEMAERMPEKIQNFENYDLQSITLSYLEKITTVK